MIKFEDLEQKDLANFNGGEGILSTLMFKNDDIKIMKATLKKGSSIGIHTHTTSLEVMYVISGKATCLIDGKEEIVNAGEIHYCPKGITHSIMNKDDLDLIMLCIVPEIKK